MNQQGTSEEVQTAKEQTQLVTFLDRQCSDNAANGQPSNISAASLTATGDSPPAKPWTNPSQVNIGDANNTMGRIAELSHSTHESSKKRRIIEEGGIPPEPDVPIKKRLRVRPHPKTKFP